MQWKITVMMEEITSEEINIWWLFWRVRDKKNTKTKYKTFRQSCRCIIPWMFLMNLNIISSRFILFIKNIEAEMSWFTIKEKTMCIFEVWSINKRHCVNYIHRGAKCWISKETDLKKLRQFDESLIEFYHRISRYNYEESAILLMNAFPVASDADKILHVHSRE